MNSLAVCLILVLVVVKVTSAADCEIDPLLDNAPLIINPNTNQVIYPNYGESTIKFNAGDQVLFTCPGATVLVESNALSTTASASCVSGARFLVDGARFLWWQVTCSSVLSAVSRFTGSNCPGGKEAEIGFDLGSGRFVRNILLCYDVNNKIALSTHYEIPSSIGGAASGTPRPSFREDADFYNLPTSVNSLYVRSGQRTTINGLLGLPSNDETYIKGDAMYFLSRGHMAARAEFFYPGQQNGTFKYINAAPQWQTFNGQNWNQVEMDTRNHASKNNLTLQVWTGIYGVTTLPHSSTNADVDLYLYASGSNRAIPVPAIYWKVVYHAESARGVVLVGLNNPYENNVSKYVYCDDISQQITWMTWNRTNLERGYSYACQIGDLKKVVPNIPDLTVSSLLV